MSNKLKLKADSRVITLDGTHYQLTVRPTWLTLMFMGKKDSRGYDRPKILQFLVTEVGTLRWKKGWLTGERLYLDVPGSNDPWKSKKKHVPYRIGVPRKGREHAIGIAMAWAIHLSNLQQTRTTPLVGPLPPREPIPLSWWESASSKLNEKLSW